MSDCIFCKLASGEIETEVVFETDQVFVFKDANPVAPEHLLVIPKAHIESVSALTEENVGVISEIFITISRLMKSRGYDETGYRVVTNTGEQAGQSVLHLHYHVLAGRNLAWPPG